MANNIIPVNTQKNGQPVFPPDVNPGLAPAGPPIPPEVQAALDAQSKAQLSPINDIAGSLAQGSSGVPKSADEVPPPMNVPGLDGPETQGHPLTQAPSDPLSDIVGSVAGAGGGGAPKKGKTIFDHIKDFLPLAGAIGGAMEAAGEPNMQHQGADLLAHSNETARNREMEQYKVQNVDMPLAQAHSDYFKAAAPAKVAVAGINADAKTDVAETANRFKLTPGGLFDTKTNSIMPGTGGGVTVTPEIAKQYKLPMDFVGKPMKLSDLAAAENAISRNLTTVQGVKGPAIVDKQAGTGRDLGLGSPAGAGAANAAVNVWRKDASGKSQLVAISRAEQLKTGEPTAQVEFGETGPTSATRNMSQMAQTIQPHLDTLREEVKELSPYLGPLMGRGEVNFAAGTVGSTGNPTLDYKLGRLMSDFKLASSAVGRTHFAGRTGLPAAQYFGELFNAKRTPEELLGILDSVPSYITGYAEMGAFQAPDRPGGGAPPAKPNIAPPAPKGGARPPGWPPPVTKGK